MANPITYGYIIAFLGGIIPTFLWLWFWWREDSGTREPLGLLFLTYIGGMLSAYVILPLESVVRDLLLNPVSILIAFAAIEEVSKIIFVVFVALKNQTITEPTDYVIYITTGALGFAALENSFFLIEPALANDVGLYLATSNLRFIGATVLHITTGALIGIMIALAHDHGWFGKIVNGLIGIILAILLHSVFNYFILLGTAQSILLAFGGIWMIGMILFVIFKTMKQLHYQPNPTAELYE
jgi:protease PrsW